MLTQAHSPTISQLIELNVIGQLKQSSQGGDLQTIQCMYCPRSYGRVSHRNRHMREAHWQLLDGAQKGGYKAVGLPMKQSHTVSLIDNSNRLLQQPQPTAPPCYPCQQCPKQFKRYSHLKRHLVSHTHIKAYSCLHPSCIMSFGYKHHLDRHVRLVHEQGGFLCADCGIEWKRKKGLAKHRREQHGCGQNVASYKMINSLGKGRNGHAGKSQQDDIGEKIAPDSLKFGPNGILPLLTLQSLSTDCRDFSVGDQKSDSDSIEEQSISSRDSDLFDKKTHTTQLAPGRRNSVSTYGPQLVRQTQQNELYRCQQKDCLSAFSQIKAFNRHIKMIHQSSK